MFDSILIAIFTYNEKKNIATILESVCKKFKNIFFDFEKSKIELQMAQ